MRWPDALIVGIFLSSLVGIGLYVSRRQKDTEAYFVARRSIPGWAMGLSVLATIITSLTFIAFPGAAYAGNWSLLLPNLMFVVVLVVAGTAIVPFYRHSVNMSAYEYFGKRFGRGIRLYSSFAFAVGHFTKMGFVYYLLALTVSSMTGRPFNEILLVTCAITILYTWIGGIEAVIWTDVLQGFVLAVGMIVCIGFLLWASPGGPHAALSDAWRHHKFSLGSTALHLDQPTILVLVIYGLFTYLQKYTADQTVIQRYLVAKTDRSAVRGIALGASLCVPVWTGFMLIGTLLWSFYRLTGDKLPASVTKADQVFPYFLSTRIPEGLAGLFLAALLGAAMSMLASDMNCLSVIGVEDYFMMLKPRSSDKTRLRAAKAIVFLSGVSAAGMGWILAHSRGSALSLYYTITAIVAGGLVGLFFLAFLCAKAGRSAAIFGVAVSLAVMIWATLTGNHGNFVNLGRWNFPWHDYMIGAVGHVTLFVTGFAFSLIFPGPPLADPGLTLWGRRARQRGLSHAELSESAIAQPRNF